MNLLTHSPSTKERISCPSTLGKFYSYRAVAYLRYSVRIVRSFIGYLIVHKHVDLNIFVIYLQLRNALALRRFICEFKDKEMYTIFGMLD